jgi:hypothetical protein
MRVLQGLCQLYNYLLIKGYVVFRFVWNTTMEGGCGGCVTGNQQLGYLRSDDNGINYAVFPSAKSRGIGKIVTGVY